jgi:hypothetical protein
MNYKIEFKTKGDVKASWTTDKATITSDLEAIGRVLIQDSNDHPNLVFRIAEAH